MPKIYLNIDVVTIEQVDDNVCVIFWCIVAFCHSEGFRGMHFSKDIVYNISLITGWMTVKTEKYKAQFPEV